MKRLDAIIAAALVTGIIAISMLFVGVTALWNPNSVPVSNSPDVPSLAGNATTSDPQTQGEINQLQALVTQYQNRENQYRAQIQQLGTQVQQLEGVLDELQRRGIIRILDDGTIQLRRGSSSGN